ncbi:MAG: FAD-binding protein, partial [Myxococcales bacterium]|nr:FAD-binding protein [Myxococcales bacterium]
MPSDEPTLAAPRMAPPPGLEAISSQSPWDRAAHRRGRAYPDLVAGFRGEYDGAPDLVARPRTAAEVAQVLESCHHHRLAVVPFGGGTSVVGGVDSGLAGAGHAGVVSLDLSHLSGLLELDAVSRVARLGAGTLGPALEAALAPHGLT